MAEAETESCSYFSGHTKRLLCTLTMELKRFYIALVLFGVK